MCQTPNPSTLWGQATFIRETHIKKILKKGGLPKRGINPKTHKTTHNVVNDLAWEGVYF